MRTVQVPIACAVFLLAASCASRPRRAALPQSPTVASTAGPAPTASRPTRLRYYDLKDIDTREGILVVRGTAPQLRAIDEHLAGIRAILQDAETGEVALRSQLPHAPSDGRTVQVHAVADIVQLLGEAMDDPNPQQTVLKTIRRGLKAGDWEKSVVRFQGKTAIVVKALPVTQDRVAAILDGLRNGAQ